MHVSQPNCEGKTSFVRLVLLIRSAITGPLRPYESLQCQLHNWKAGKGHFTQILNFYFMAKKAQKVKKNGRTELLIVNPDAAGIDIASTEYQVCVPEDRDPEHNRRFGAFTEDLRKVHEEILSKAVERAIRLKPMLKITTELKEGNTPSQIIETAANGGFDLIVVGHMGESGIKEFLLGSTSERVVHQARCAVLVVK